MRRKHKIRYSVMVPEKWWNKGWHDDPVPGSSGSRWFCKAKKAFAHASMLPAGTRVTTHYYKHGERWSRDYYAI